MTATDPDRPHLVVVGAGVVGLGHAAEGLRRGWRVTVLEQAGSVVGASVRNFGHAAVTAQDGDALRYARTARERWLDLGRAAGLDVREVGTHVVARTDAELAVLGELAQRRAPGEVEIWTAEETAARVPVARGDVVGGAHLTRDLQVDPRAAAPALARWLQTQGVDIRWRTAAREVRAGLVRTTRGDVPADAVVVAAHHDVDRLLPELAERAQVRRCRLHMLRLRPRAPLALTAPLLTGWAIGRYAGLAACPSAPAVAAELVAADPDGVAWDLNLMATPQADGTIVAGDTHLRDVDAPPFQDEAGFTILQQRFAQLFGRDDLEVVERWQGVYATAPSEFLLTEPEPGVHVAVVTTGIGMTTGLGLAVETLDRIEETA